MVHDTLGISGDQDSTLVDSHPEEWIHTPSIMGLLDREAQHPKTAAFAEAPASGGVEGHAIAEDFCSQTCHNNLYRFKMFFSIHILNAENVRDIPH